MLSLQTCKQTYVIYHTGVLYDIRSVELCVISVVDHISRGQEKFCLAFVPHPSILTCSHTTTSHTDAL